MNVTVVHIKEPFAQECARFSRPPGSSIRSTMPSASGRMICRVNGGPGYVPRAQWDSRLMPGDVVEWEEHPGGGEDDGGIWRIALAFAVSIATENPAPLLLAFAGLASTFFVDTRRPDEFKQSSPTYSTGLQGNQARLYSVVPKICGRHHTFPPFAAQPYQEFDSSGEQYLYVLLALGIGNHEVERILIDDTDISHFSDVLTAEYLPPGTQPATVVPNVINCPEVGGQDMLTGQYIGGFATCAPRSIAASLGFDVIAPYGLGVQDATTGALSGLEVSWRIEIRPINEFGTATGPWVVLANESRTAANREPQRWSVKYDLDTPARVEARILRTDVKSASVHYLNDLVWSGMRAYLDGEVTLHPNVAHIELVMRSSKQLSNVSQNRIAVIATGMCRELLPDGTFSSDEIASRNAADWMADLWTSPIWGEGLDEVQCDLATLASLKAVWEARQDRFDYVFDTAISAEDAGQIIAESGRARCFRRGGVRTLVRDQLVTLPRTAFTTRNTVAGSMTAEEELPSEDLPDGLIVEYFDNRDWKYRSLECPAPGVVSMVKPQRLRLQGVTGSNHAKREGLYRAARMVLRRRTVECETEMQAILPAFGSAVRWQSETSRWKSGDVVSWDSGTLAMRLTEPPDWTISPQHIVLIGDDGVPTTPIQISPGSDATSVVLASNPGIDISTDIGTRERTQFLIGGLADDEELVKLSSIDGAGTTPEGAQLYRIGAFVDDDRVHEADNAYLPSPGEIQDPIDTSEGEPGGGTAPIVNLTNHSITQQSTSTTNTSQFHFYGDGRMAKDFTGGNNFAYFPDEWLYQAPVESETAALFEVRFTLQSGSVSSGGGNFDAWLPANVDYTFQVVNDSPYLGEEAQILVEVRDVATETLQDSCLILLAAYEDIHG